jgi:large subunit ribosomal protein L9
VWYNLAPQSVVPFALILARKGLKTMKVLLIKDVYKLGRAGDVKKVADGFGRNFLLPQKLAVLATPGAMKTSEKVRAQGEIKRTALNSELKDLADHINGVVLDFAVKAGETGKLYGSITTQDVATGIQEQTRYEVKRQQIDMQPIRELGEYKAHVRLTLDLMPEIKIIVHREGEALEVAEPAAKAEKSRGRKKAEEAPAAEPEPAPAEASTEEPAASE